MPIVLPGAVSSLPSLQERLHTLAAVFSSRRSAATTGMV